MSLINQVLRDLDARRDRPADSDQMALQGLGLAAVPGRDWRRLAVYVALAVAVAVLGLMLWQWQLHRSTAQGTPEIHLPLPEPVQRTRVRTAPAEARTTAVARVETREDDKQPVSPVTDPAVVTAAPVVAKNPRTNAPPVPEVTAPAKEAPPQIRKQVRPLTDGQKAELRYQQAVKHIQSGDLRAAEQALAATLKLDSVHHTARMTLAGLLLDQDRREPALVQMQEGLAVLPGDKQFAMLAGRLFLDQSDAGNAVAVLEQGLPAGARDPDYRALLAAAYQRSGDHRRAITEYRAAAELAPDNGNWWMGLGLAAERTGNSNGARKAYEQALRVSLAPKLKTYVKSRLSLLTDSAGTGAP